MRGYSCLKFLMLLPALPLAGQGGGPQCLHLDTPAGGYSGAAAPFFETGNVLDDCAAFPAIGSGYGYGWENPSDWRSQAVETIRFGAARDGFGFWTAASREVSLRFFLGGVLQYDSGWLDPAADPYYWFRPVSHDAIEIRGALPVIFYSVDDAIDPELTEDMSGEDWVEQPPAIASTVPEPATITLIGTGLAGLAAARRRERLLC